MYNTEKILLTLGILLALILIILALVPRILYLKDGLRYLNCEIGRSDALERKLLKKEKRKLILSFFFPFIKLEV